MTIRIFALVFLCMSHAAAGAQAVDKPIAPYELMRSWQIVQDDVLRGNRKAFASQRKLLAAIARRFDSYAPETWLAPRNLRAAVLLSLSGGPSTVLKKLAREKKLPKEFSLLGPGAIAVSARRRREAWHFLSRVNAREAHPMLAAHIALVKGKLIARQKPKEAFTQFNEARLMAPGTLIEEAALRRQVALADAAGFSDDLAYLSRAYVRRFSKSPYLKSFLRIFSSAAVRKWSGTKGRDFARINSVARMLPTKVRHMVLVDIARVGLGSGKHDLVRAASKAVSDEAATSDDGIHQRARLYGAASRIFSKEYETAVSSILSVEESVLKREDVELRKATLTLARAIRRWPDSETVAEVPVEKKDENQPITLADPVKKTPKPDIAEEAIKKAQDAIAGTAAFLGGKI